MNYWTERKHRKLAAKPFPDLWQKCLSRNVKHYTRLPPGLRDKLHGLIHIFMKEIPFVSCGVGIIMDRMQACIAAEACILILNRSFNDYRRLECVQIWQDKPEGEEEDWAGGASSSVVSLKWDETLHGMTTADDNFNVILHEFAHVLDYLDDNTPQSVPVPKNSLDRKMWEELVDHEYQKLELAHKDGGDHVIRKYSLKTYGDEKCRSEFFPCATEAFFERSTRLQRECPRIYQALKSFYQLSPAEWEKAT